MSAEQFRGVDEQNPLPRFPENRSRPPARVSYNFSHLPRDTVWWTDHEVVFVTRTIYEMVEIARQLLQGAEHILGMPEDEGPEPPPATSPDDIGPERYWVECHLNNSQSNSNAQVPGWTIGCSAASQRCLNI